MAGFAYRVPNPLPLKAYTEMNGDVVMFVCAYVSPAALNEAPPALGDPETVEAGLAYFVPIPEATVNGYAATHMPLSWATATLLIENETALPTLEGNVAGLAYFVPNPVLSDHV